MVLIGQWFIDVWFLIALLDDQLVNKIRHDQDTPILELWWHDQRKGLGHGLLLGLVVSVVWYCTRPNNDGEHIVIWIFHVYIYTYYICKCSMRMCICRCSSRTSKHEVSDSTQLMSLSYSDFGSKTTNSFSTRLKMAIHLDDCGCRCIVVQVNWKPTDIATWCWLVGGLLVTHCLFSFI